MIKQHLNREHYHKLDIFMVNTSLGSLKWRFNILAKVLYPKSMYFKEISFQLKMSFLFCDMRSNGHGIMCHFTLSMVFGNKQ